MRSARGHLRIARLGLLAICGLLLLGVASGCATTQDTAAKRQAESRRILEAREKKREEKTKSHDHGSEKR